MEAQAPARSADVAIERVGQDVILYDRRSGRAHVINGSAARVWDLCDGRATLGEITAAFAAAYGLAPSAVSDDVAAIMATFRSLKVIE